MGSQMARSLSEAGRDVVVFDKLTYAGHLAHIEGVKHEFIEACICDESAVRAAMDGVDVVVHMAAESHVANSLHEPDSFLQTNVVGTRVLLSEACAAGVPQFIHVSTDEVFGESQPGVAFAPQRSHEARECIRGFKSGCGSLGSCLATYAQLSSHNCPMYKQFWTATTSRESHSLVDSGRSFRWTHPSTWRGNRGS